MAEREVNTFKKRVNDWEKPNPDPKVSGPRTREGVMKVTQNLPAVEERTPWQMTPEMKAKVSKVISMANTKHGLSAAVPIICKGSKCPYANTCPLYLDNEAPEGERCPLEIGTIMHLFQQYCDDLGVDMTSVVNLGLVKDLIDCHIMIQRADALIAASGAIVEEVAVGVNDEGEVVTQPQLVKALEVKEKYLNLKTKILNQLNATPKDKASDKNTVVMDPSRYAAELMRRAKKLQEKNIIDVEPIDEGDNDEGHPRSQD